MFAMRWRNLLLRIPLLPNCLAFATDPNNALDALNDYQGVIADILTGPRTRFAGQVHLG